MAVPTTDNITRKIIRCNHFGQRHDIFLLYNTFYNASHKSNSSSVPRGIVDLYSTLPGVAWEAVAFVEGIPW